ncbi:MAG TPA: MFS transporter, partial [Tepidisphaeraceae bacterium]|nr:MFS transporter [Tepidisphaeraceae bacterium]
TVLHAMTHAYGTALVPLYLLIVADLKLAGVGMASLIVTIYGLVYCISSYPAGVLADRFDRKILLGVGLLGNAIAIAAMGLTRQYEMLIALAVIGGIFGTLFHPAANALVPAHYPRSPGMAIGLLGIGSGLGFFFGPQYAGWRAQSAHWHLMNVADWQRPCIELGIMGVVIAIVFLIFAREAEPSHHDESDSQDAMLPNRMAIEAIVTDMRGQHRTELSSSLRKKVIAIAAVLGCRDFAGVASLSLMSIYLQKAHGYSTKQAGFVVGGMMLISVIVNPLAVYFSPGKRRLPALVLVCVLGGLSISIVPLVRVVWALPVMCVFQSFQMGSYAISDAAMLERVSARVRGRVVGLFLTLAGTFASLSPWAMGFWTDLLKNRAHEPLAYLPIFGTLGAMLILASFSTPLLNRLGQTSPQPRLTRPVGERILKNLQ